MSNHTFFYVYVLQSQSHPERFYTGYTTNSTGPAL
jgi:predicted GIY-YIG superfamily endonuclease